MKFKSFKKLTVVQWFGIAYFVGIISFLIAVLVAEFFFGVSDIFNWR
jgi:hypothetical protein